VDRKDKKNRIINNKKWGINRVKKEDEEIKSEDDGWKG
jgi:hypothetical protein